MNALTALLMKAQVKENSAYQAVASNTSGTTPKELFEDFIEDLSKQVWHQCLIIGELCTSSPSEFDCVATCYNVVCGELLTSADSPSTADRTIRALRSLLHLKVCLVLNCGGVFEYHVCYLQDQLE